VKRSNGCGDAGGARERPTTAAADWSWGRPEHELGQEKQRGRTGLAVGTECQQAEGQGGAASGGPPRRRHVGGRGKPPPPPE
jgi:hypothetical protein